MPARAKVVSHLTLANNLAELFAATVIGLITTANHLLREDRFLVPYAILAALEVGALSLSDPGLLFERQ